MGSVWRAVRNDGRFDGEVALKLLARTTGGSAAERFTLEGHYLARLSHPNIARLMDAGVGPESQPYLVLEYVDGQPIDRYCDTKALGFDGRIRLFLQVLDAVAHAHAHLIVHRDINPSNVQVSADGIVKLLDFGVAKLIDAGDPYAAAGLTRELGAALTPEYAAPEQLHGDSVTTATDVYSLGL
jgi:serine/threonine-protein kinase